MTLFTTIKILFLPLALAGLVSCTSTQTLTDADPSKAIVKTDPVNNQPSGPSTLRTGTFSTVAPGHSTSGTAKLIRLENGDVVLRLEGFSTVPGPDVHVWLSKAKDVKAGSGIAEAEHIDIGKIKSTNGDQNYGLAPGADLGGLTGVVIWCQSFGVNFGAAQFE